MYTMEIFVMVVTLMNTPDERKEIKEGEGQEKTYCCIEIRMG